MDPVQNPYGPGAGTPPPELTGRGPILAAADVALKRLRAGRPSKSQILVGLRGVGKTVLLNRIADLATGAGFRVSSVEASEGKSLPALLTPTLRSILYDLDRAEGLSTKVKRALRVLRSFVGKLALKMGDVELELDVDPEKGTADSGDLETDLGELLVSIGEAAEDRKAGLALIVDELQYLSEAEFGALIMALHRCTQRSLPLAFVGAALPSVRGLAGRSKSYAERLFDFPEVGPLSAADASDAIQLPAIREDAAFTAAAVDRIYELTQGYPYFLQEWAYHTWNVADASPIALEDVDAATPGTIERLDAGFFRVRFDRLTPSERKYLRAMAELGSGPYRTNDIAAAYGAKIASVGPTRAQLVAKGMIYSPAYGDLDFTVPMFDDYMRRTMPYEPPKEQTSESP